MMRLMRFFMVSCRKAGVLIEKKLSGELSRVEKVQLSVHLRVCKACMNYEKQSELLDKAFGSKRNNQAYPAPDDFKEKLKEKFD